MTRSMPTDYPTAAPGPTVRHRPEALRYEALLGDDVAGFAEYELSEGLITFPHTEIDPAFEGRGVGSALIKGALDDVRATGERRVRPLCPFVERWMQRHPDYTDLLDGR